MNILFHDEDFNKKMLEKFFEALNSPDEIIRIYLSSSGGHVHVLEAMLYAVNLDPKRFIIIGYNELCSCAFEFYIKASCEKSLLPGTLGMYHQTLSDITLNDVMKPAYAEDQAHIKKKRNYFLPSTREFMINCEFTEKELKKVNKNHDVYFQYDRFKEIENAYNKNTQL